jgi:hypothetical protein
VSTQTIATTKRYYSDDVCLSAITKPCHDSFEVSEALPTMTPCHNMQHIHVSPLILHYSFIFPLLETKASIEKAIGSVAEPFLMKIGKERACCTSSMFSQCLATANQKQRESVIQVYFMAFFENEKMNTRHTRRNTAKKKTGIWRLLFSILLTINH